MVHSHHVNGHVVLRRSRDDGLLGSTVEMEGCLLKGSEGATALADVVSSDAAPWDLGGILLLEDLDLVSIDLDAAVDLLDLALESSYTHRVSN